MANLQRRIIDKDFHPNASTEVQETVLHFADALILESKTVASLEGSDEVQTVHVTKAKAIVFSATHKANRVRDIFIFVGSLLLGLSVQGFLQEYGSPQPRVGWMAVYAGLGVLGTVLSVAAFLRQ